METLEYDYRVFQNREADKNLAVRFFKQPVQNDHKSAEEGRPIFEDTVMVEIRVRGDRNNVVIRPAREEDKKRFHDIWRAFQQGEELTRSGTPLAEWPVMTASMAKELEFFGFFTVEQVAEANDTIASRMPGIQNMKKRAQMFLEMAKGLAPAEKLQKDLETRESELAAAQSQINDLAKRLAALEAKK